MRSLPSPSAINFSAALVSAAAPEFLGSSSRFDLTRSFDSLNSFSIASSVSLVLAVSAAAMLDAIRLLLERTLPSCSTVRAARVASSGFMLAEPRMALIWVWASSIAGLAAATNSA
jgi:hypothetical protein